MNKTPLGFCIESAKDGTTVVRFVKSPILITTSTKMVIVVTNGTISEISLLDPPPDLNVHVGEIIGMKEKIG